MAADCGLADLGELHHDGPGDVGVLDRAMRQGAIAPMIAPSGHYRYFPALSPEEAAQMIADVMIDKPKRKASRLGTFGEVLYAVSPSGEMAVGLNPTERGAAAVEALRVRALSTR